MSREPNATAVELARFAETWATRGVQAWHEGWRKIVIDVPDGERKANALIAVGVIADYRPNAGIRIAPHFYNTEEEVTFAMETLASL